MAEDALMRPEDYDFETHCEYLATTGGGKSKGAGSNARECVKAGCGIDAIDLKSGMCEDMLDWLAYWRPKVPIVHFKPSSPDIVRFNVFMPRGDDPEEHAVRMAKALLKCRGESDREPHPMLEDKLPMLLAWCAASGETVQSASRLLHFHNRKLWLNAAGRMRTQHLRDKCTRACGISDRDWDYHFGSTLRKLEPFLHEGPLRRFTSTAGCFDYAKLRAEHGIFLVDISRLADETSRIFAALIIALQLHVSSNAEDEIPRFVFFDEPQEYETADMVSLLNLTRSSGYRISLIHHYSDQWENKAMASACKANARITYVMHGVPPEECRAMVEGRFLPLVNARWHKEEKFRTEMEWDDEEAESVTDREDGTSSVTRSPRLRPRQYRVPDGWVDYTREEKISMLMEPLVALQPREYCKFTPDGDEWGEFRHLEDYSRLLSEETRIRFRESLHPPSVHDEPKTSTTERSPDAKPSGRTKKKPANLHAQG